MSHQYHIPNFAQKMILCKISAANTDCKYPNRNKNMRNAALQSWGLFVTKCKISTTQFSYGVFIYLYSTVNCQVQKWWWQQRIMTLMTVTTMIAFQCNECYFQSALLTYFRPARLISLRHGYIYHRRQVVWFFLPSFCSIFKILFTLHRDTSLGIVNRCINLQAGTACKPNDR